MKYLAIDSQVLSSYSACPRRCKFAFRDRLVKKEGNKYFDMGKIVHHALEVYYKAVIERVPYAERVKNALLSANTYAVTETEIDEANLQICIKSLNTYFGYRKEERLRPIAVEAPFSKVLYVGSDLIGDEITIAYEGLIDLFAEVEGEEAVIDHKSTFKWQLQDPMDMRVQFLGYRWATGKRVIVNRFHFSEKHAPSDRFRRFTFKYDDRTISDFQSYATGKALEYARDVETGVWKPNFRACEGEYGYGCDFANVCRYPSLAAETKEMEFKIGEKWDIFKEKNT